MATPTSVSPQEVADRIAIRQLIDAYAHCADRRLAEEQKSLFIDDAHFVVFMDGEGIPASQEFHAKEDLTPVFTSLRAYSHTTHFNGQSTIDFRPDGNTASGETYCIAHHLMEKEGKRHIFIASLRYHDVVKRGSNGRWLFAERKLYLDWSETRPSNV